MVGASYLTVSHSADEESCPPAQHGFSVGGQKQNLGMADGYIPAGIGERKEVDLKCHNHCAVSFLHKKCCKALPDFKALPVVNRWPL